MDNEQRTIPRNALIIKTNIFRTSVLLDRKQYKKARFRRKTQRIRKKYGRGELLK